ncbi:MAG: VCBS repeat-containing protein [Opitutales bacterium]|nr:VCBS repeat-containing protein [Opitutales bacterium]
MIDPLRRSCAFTLIGLLSYLGSVSSSFALPLILEGPEILKLDWNTRSLDSADINGNGRTDLALINNDRASIELLLRRAPEDPPPDERRSVRRNRWEPILTDAAFTRRTLITGQVAHALALGDFNGSGRTDIAFTGNRIPLTILYQDEDGDFGERREIRSFEPRQWARTIVAADLNNDGRTDLVVLANEDLLIFSQQTDGTFGEPAAYRLSGSNAIGLRVADLNGNGLTDLAYITGETNQRHLAVRFQRDGGGFGPEFLLPLDVAHSSLTLLPQKGEAPILLYAEHQTRLVRTARLIERTPTENPEFEQLQARSHALPTRLRDPALYTTGDFDGNGRLSIVAANPARAEVLLFRQNEHGAFGEAVPFPSLSGITALATHRPQGSDRDHLVVGSAEEGVVGLSHVTSTGRLSFPRIHNIEGRPLLVASGILESPDTPALVVLERRGRTFHLTHISTQADAPNRSFALEGISRDPRAIRFARLGASTEPDHLLILGQREALRLYQWDGEKEELAERAAGSDLRRSLLGDVEPHQLTIGTRREDATGTTQWLVAGNGFVRILQTDGNDFTLEDQFNARPGSTRLRVPLPFDDGTANGAFLVFDAERNELHLHRADETGVIRFRSNLALPPMNLLGATFHELSTGRTALILFGEERFFVVPLDGSGWEFMDAFDPHETDLRDMTYMGFVIADLNANGRPEVIGLDATNHIMEILATPEADRGWRSLLHFTLFERNLHVGQRRTGGGFQPREAIAGNFGPDNRPAIALLVHDRLLVYAAQLPPEPLSRRER